MSTAKAKLKVTNKKGESYVIKKRRDVSRESRKGQGTSKEVAGVPILVAARLRKPLGNPPSNGIKFFAASELLERVKDCAWLVKVTNAVNQHVHNQNARKKNRSANVAQNGNESALKSPYLACRRTKRVD
jgi:hypothetical protein